LVGLLPLGAAAQPVLQEVLITPRSDERGYVIRFDVDAKLAPSQVRVFRPSDNVVDVMLYNVSVDSQLVRSAPVGPIVSYTVEQRKWTAAVRFTLTGGSAVDVRSYPDRSSEDYLVALNVDQTAETEAIAESSEELGDIPAEVREDLGVYDDETVEAAEPDEEEMAEPEMAEPEVMEPEMTEEVEPVVAEEEAPVSRQPDIFVDGSRTPPSDAPRRSAAERRVTRAYVPPDQIVSFLPSTPFDQFLRDLNPIFERVTGKRVIDLESRVAPIGIPIVGTQFFDALELVLSQFDLTYRETEQYFILEDAPEPTLFAERIGATEDLNPTGNAAFLADLSTREIEIEAILFDLNQSRAKELGLNWNTVLTANAGGESLFAVNTEDVFKPLDDFLIAPNVIDAGILYNFFRAAEQNGVGETVANPSVTVKSGERAELQIGSDFPIQVRDFAGNAITSYIQTGIIINVVPTLIKDALADTMGSPEFEFIHLDVNVERSSGRPLAGGQTAVDRSGAKTQVLLLDDEMTIIGGLFSTEETFSRSGVPILKDLPGWFFGLRYIFGYQNTSLTQRELLIVLRAKLREPLLTRMEKVRERSMIQAARRRALQSLQQFDPDVAREYGLDIDDEDR
ncbi:MAG: type II and III secretion system protein, partial [Bacteroidota bacterium]